MARRMTPRFRKWRLALRKLSWRFQRRPLLLILLGLASSGYRIIAKDICFGLQLPEPMLENIADTYDAHESIAVLDRHVANAPPRHQLHHIGDAVLR